MICALNKMPLAGMLKVYALPESCQFTGLFIPNPIYSTKPVEAETAYRGLTTLEVVPDMHNP